jgi:hypothetical protein|tara:strand:- start:141 stop:515 length:375 start_codon:yes stop_codon:yes gene_type:complete
MSTKKNKGLGDTIAKITKATGIDKLAKTILGEDCNKCEERRKKLNQMFPNFRNIRQFTEDEMKIYDEVIPAVDKKGMLTPAERGIVSALYVGVFGVNPEWKSCSPCNKQIMNNLKKVYEKSCKI